MIFLSTSIGDTGFSNVIALTALVISVVTFIITVGEKWPKLHAMVYSEGDTFSIRLENAGSSSVKIKRVWFTDKNGGSIEEIELVNLFKDVPCTYRTVNVVSGQCMFPQSMYKLFATRVPTYNDLKEIWTRVDGLTIHVKYLLFEFIPVEFKYDLTTEYEAFKAVIVGRNNLAVFEDKPELDMADYTVVLRKK